MQVAESPKRSRDAPNNYVIVSGYHDYRSRRRANLHFIADELKTRGSVFFLSLRFSRLSRLKDDPRHDLTGRSNRLETSNGVLCYLRYTPVHPFRMPPSLGVLERALFALYAARLPAPVRAQIERADTIFVESGIAITFVPLLKRLNATAEIIYMASDSLQAIGQADTIRRQFAAGAHLVTGARVPSPYLRADIPAEISTYFIPHGIDKAAFEHADASPYAPGTLNAVSVGSMLFDPTFFEIAGAAFPHVTFHAIGSGHRGPARANVIYHPEMAFRATLPYLKHCSFAIAPYDRTVERYLTHTSMKLMQYHYLGLPAVCPELIALPERGRFGYVWGDEASIRAAVASALAAGRVPRGACLTWGDVTDRLLAPGRYPDTVC